MSDFIVFSGSMNLLFAERVAASLGAPLGEIAIGTFPDGEVSVEILESVREKEVFVVQSVAGDPNRALMELLLIADALKRASAGRVIAVLPYFGYARQDRRAKGRGPITARLVANMLEVAHFDSVVTVDLHTLQIEGFFDIPVQILSAHTILFDTISELGLDDPIVVSPDLGSIKIARWYADRLECDFATLDKKRLSAGEVEVTKVIGDVRGRTVILTDDMISTAGTITAAAHQCSLAGAKEIIAVASHGIFVDGAEERIDSSPISKVYISDTVRTNTHSQKIEVISVAELVGEAIGKMYAAQSLLPLETGVRG